MVASKARVYLDHAATTPVLPSIVEIVSRYFSEEFGNASSIHEFGVRAHGAIDQARESVARFINARTGDIIFTSSGTESDNLAIQGYAFKHRHQRPHLITSVIEHPAVHKTMVFLEASGFEVSWIPVDGDGVVDVGALERAIRSTTGLISIQLANNEIGTVQPVDAIAALAASHGIQFHVDAVQALGKLPVDVARSGITMLSASGHKLCAPKGAGFLYLRDHDAIQPLLFGGDHEGGFRPSTENVPAIAGLGAAIDIISRDMNVEARRQRYLRDHLVDHVLAEVPGSRVNGSKDATLPNIASLSFDGASGFDLVLGLDREGFAVSPGSACHSRVSDPSRVLLAIGLDAATANSTIRVSLGRTTTVDEVDRFLACLPGVVSEAREP